MDPVNYFLGSECGVDIYEENDRGKWVECSVKKMRYILIVVTIVFIIFLLFTMMSNPTGAAVGGIVGGLILGGLWLTGEGYWASSAGMQYDRYQKELASYTANGMSRADAIREIKHERLERERNDILRASNAAQRPAVRFSV